MSSAGLALNQNSQQPGLEKYTVPVSRCLALEVYSSTKPHNLKIAGLQKGLVFVCNGTEKIGKEHVQFYGKRFLGKRGYSVVGSPFEREPRSIRSLLRIPYSARELRT